MTGRAKPRDAIFSCALSDFKEPIVGVLLLFGLGIPEHVPRLATAQEVSAEETDSLGEFREQVRANRIAEDEAKVWIYVIIGSPFFLLLAMFFALWLKSGTRSDYPTKTEVDRSKRHKLPGRYEQEQHYGHDDFDLYS